MTLTLPLIVTGLVIAGVLVIIATYYAKEIGRGLLITSLLVITSVIAMIVLSQKAASFKQVQATNNAVKVVKTMATTQTIAVTVGACIFGGLVTITITSLTIAVVLYYQHTLTTKSPPGRRQIVTTPANTRRSPPPTPPLTQLPTYYIPQGTGDITRIDPKDWGW